jgi:hypothetical protein
LPLATLLRRFIVLTVITVTALALPSDAAARKVFRSADHRVVCHLARVGTLPPVAACESRATLRRNPEAPEIRCGSGLSQALVRARGRTLLYETCNPIWLPSYPEPIRTLKVHDKVTSKYFKCSALSKRTIRCASKLTGHGFKLSRTTFKRF